jgi:hypothetical protein
VKETTKNMETKQEMKTAWGFVSLLSFAAASFFFHSPEK